MTGHDRGSILRNNSREGLLCCRFGLKGGGIYKMDMMKRGVCRPFLLLVEKGGREIKSLISVSSSPEEIYSILLNQSIQRTARE